MWQNELSTIVWTYPHGAIELGGNILFQVIILTIVGAFSYVNAPSKRYTEALLLTIPITIGNYLLAFLVNFFLLFFFSWQRNLGLLQYSFAEVSFERPSLLRASRELCITVVVFEVLFYFGHRALHYRWLYKKVHAVHHHFEEKQVPVPLSNFYSHPLEFLFAYNLINIAAALQHSHVFIYWSTAALAAMMTMYLHSGRDLPGIMSHHVHHARRNCNFSAFGGGDWLFRTRDVDMPKSIAARR